VAPRSAEPVRSAKVQVIKEVKIFFYYPPARKVAVTGDFNGWNPDGVPLKAAGKPGLWEAELRLPPGVYSYNFIVDGELLVPDPNSPNQMPDGYGGTNSLMLVKGKGSI
jgi:1,4-alpha-glucan branching enzyme